MNDQIRRVLNYEIEGTSSGDIRFKINGIEVTEQEFKEIID